MIQELLYTSYQGKGLRPGGGGGYCTVLSSSGMAANLATTLEMLSGYKHPFDVHDERAPQSPPNCRHAIIRLGGADVHVLSRIADAGGDHTGRSNKLAHHLALAPTDVAELLAAGAIGGPSALLSDPRISRHDWDQKVQLVSPLEPARVPAGDLPNRPCMAWERVAGDAGWAGIVADRLLAGDGQPTSIIYPLGTDALELLNEVLSLIPPQRRWSITFSTYYTAALPNSSCHLRMLLDGTPEAAVLRRDYRQVIVDLAAPLVGAEDSPLVAAARSGEIRHPQVAATPGPRRARGAGAAGAAAATRGGGAANLAPLETLPSLDANDAELELEPLSASSGTRAGGFRIFKSKARSGYAPSRPASPWKAVVIASAIVAVAMMVIIGAGVLILVNSGEDSPPHEIALKNKQQPSEGTAGPNADGSVTEKPGDTADQPPQRDDSQETQNESAKESPSKNEVLFLPNNPASNPLSSSEVTSDAPPSSKPKLVLLNTIPKIAYRDKATGDTQPPIEVEGGQSTVTICSLPGSKITKLRIAGIDDLQTGEAGDRSVLKGASFRADVLRVQFHWPGQALDNTADICFFKVSGGDVSFTWNTAELNKLKAQSKTQLADAIRRGVLFVSYDGQEHPLLLSHVTSPVSARVLPSEFPSFFPGEVMPPRDRLSIKVDDTLTYFQALSPKLRFSTHTPSEHTATWHGTLKLDHIPQTTVFEARVSLEGLGNALKWASGGHIHLPPAKHDGKWRRIELGTQEELSAAEHQLNNLNGLLPNEITHWKGEIEKTNDLIAKHKPPLDKTQQQELTNQKLSLAEFEERLRLVTAFQEAVEIELGLLRHLNTTPWTVNVDLSLSLSPKSSNVLFPLCGSSSGN